MSVWMFLAWVLKVCVAIMMASAAAGIAIKVIKHSKRGKDN